MLLAQRWALSTAAILTRINEDAPYLLGGGPRNRDDYVKSAQDVLASSWGAQGADKLRSTIEWLREEGHSASYEKAQGECNQLLSQYGPNLAFEQYYPEEAQKYRFVQQFQQAIGQRSLLAWDAGRLVSVAGWGYLAGYIEEQEAWSYILPAATLLQRAYTSWQELSDHYIWGLMFWGGDPAKSQKAQQELLQGSESPYVSIPWLTPISIPGVTPVWGQRWARMYGLFAEPVFPHPQPQVSRHRDHPEMQLLKDYDGAQLVVYEGQRRWQEQYEQCISRDQWADDWGPLARSNWDFNTQHELLKQFFADEEAFKQLERENPNQVEQELQRRGYRSVGQFFRARITMSKHFGTPGGSWLAMSAFDDIDTQNAMMQAFRVNQDQGAAKALAAHPELTAPIEGIDLKAMAALAAHQTSGTAGQEWINVLAQYRLDETGYARVSEGWRQRFQNDPSGVLGQTYSKIYTDELAEVQKARVASGAAKEISFEFYCEVAGAQVAWGQKGLDPNVEIERVFGMSMLDFSMAGMPWGTKMGTDMNLLSRYMQLLDQYTLKHGGSVAQPEPDEPDEEEQDEPDEPDEDDDDDDDDDDF
ncbi:MAG: DUF1266 domain-containing protein [Polyangiaceae bacterium]